MTTSNCTMTFTGADLDPTRLPNRCPVKNCEKKLVEVSYRRSKVPICAFHGIRIHPSSKTFEYYNGDTPNDRMRASLRNICFAPELFKNHFLNSKWKAESHRFNAEHSEDALTWNVFAPMASDLKPVFKWLTGKADVPSKDIKLYLWGLPVEPQGGPPEPYPPLIRVREKLEGDIRRFKTEPDIMLCTPHCLVCIEAKFTSGNPLAHDTAVQLDEKPKRSDELIRRYLPKSGPCKGMSQESIGPKLHSQLFRMFVFTCAMAQLTKKTDWCVINLVSQTQWEQRRNREQCHYDYSDPSDAVPADVRSHFGFRFWEGLFRELISPNPSLKTVASYMSGKTAHLQPAFRFDSMTVHAK